MNSIEDFYLLVKYFSDKNIKFLITGGIAMSFYYEPRATKDLDIIINLDTKDRGKLRVIIIELGGNLSFSYWVEEGVVDRFTLPFWEQLDVFYNDKRDFKVLWNEREIFGWKDLNLNLIGVKDLIKKKLRRYNTQDRIDIERLMKRYNITIESIK